MQIKKTNSGKLLAIEESEMDVPFENNAMLIRLIALAKG